MNRLPILQLVLLPLFAMGYLYSQVPYTISSSGQLADIFSAAVDSVHLILEPGTYEMEPVSIIDSTCGNCEDPNSTGACGISITLQGDSAQYGFLTGNIVVKTAQNPKYDDPDYYCYQCALAIQACPDDFVIDNNLFFMNRRASDDLPDFDVSESVFREQIMTRYDILKHLTFFHSSDFYNITGLLKAN
jgi:hypothetical protein